MLLSFTKRRYSAPNEKDVLDFVDELEKTLGSLEDEVQVCSSSERDSND